MDNKEKIETYLEAIGYKKEEKDDAILKLLEERIVNTILILIRNKELPEQLNHIVVIRTVGEFLRLKQSSNNLGIEGLKFDLIVTEKSIGRTKINLSKPTTMKSPIELFSENVSRLLEYGEEEIKKFRKIRW